MPQSRRQLVFFILGGFFLTNAILAELTGGKLFVPPTIDLGFAKFEGVVLSIGVLLWPVVFITTDLINEYYGKRGVRLLTFLTVAMVSLCFILLFLADRVPAWEKSPVSEEAFSEVFNQSRWIIVGSLTAFVFSQLVDVLVFTSFRRWTQGRFLWLRATGSTVVSQLVDSYIVAYIGFVVPGKLAFWDCMGLATNNYAFKLTIAILVTPLIYLGHALIDRFLAKDESQDASA